ncbi:MAG: hypothetical protein U5N56_13120 [Candidatus Marinimicrobia bacterium]|nr:hypothetical protein [Candidatus Neomarinimicrobiota bacterium]
MITPQTAKAVLDEAAAEGDTPTHIIEKKGLKQISDSDELESLIDTIIGENPGLVRRFKSGETKLLGFFIGQVMLATKGQADPAATRKIINKKLEK